MTKVWVQFSCGAASAVAWKLATQMFAGPEYDVEAINAFLKEEHPDNRRFLKDVEAWIGAKVRVLCNDKYEGSAHEVWRRERYMTGPNGAACTKRLKREILDVVKSPGDIMVLGYTAEEQDRYDRFLDANNIRCEAPLIERGLTKSDCLAILDRQGIEMPMMYRLGYSNANCIGCPNGGEGYWNKIRDDFPEVFEKVAVIQEDIGPGAFFFRDRKTGERYGLRALPEGKGHYPSEPSINCSFFCEMADQDMRPRPSVKGPDDE